MRLSNRFIINTALAIVAVLLTFETHAQTSREEMLADLYKTGGVYYAYPVTESENTPAPKGYKPFYVSHYGRHGSRYLISDNDYKNIAGILHKANKKDALTPLGVDVMHRLDSLMLETDLRGGDLTPLGVRQHRGIAERMIKAYPDAFKGNKDISARSTLVVRCVLSMDAFCERLKEINPGLNITRESSQRYMDYLCHHGKAGNEWRDDPANYKELYRKFEIEHTRPERMIRAIFSDPEFVKMEVNPHDFMWGMYWIASGMQDTETKLSFYDVFTPDELFDLWQCFNFRFYAGDGNFAGSKGLIIDNAKPLIKNIIESAEAAIADGNTAATLRFGHDGNLIPLAARLHLEDCDISEGNPDKFFEAFSDWKIAPMAGNVQLVFFRDEKHPDRPILVKFMLNEREKRIPVVTDIFPFYRWDDVREYYSDCM